MLQRVCSFQMVVYICSRTLLNLFDNLFDGFDSTEERPVALLSQYLYFCTKDVLFVLVKPPVIENLLRSLEQNQVGPVCVCVCVCVCV
jgi:hypothetical protein